MEYKSPIPILKYADCDVESLSAAQLLRVQKRLLVELDLSGGATLTIEGQQLTKDDILTFIESLKVEHNIKFHKWIYENASLLQLLQKSDISVDTELFDRSLTYQYHFKDFKFFISPYLAPALSKAMSQAFQRRDFAKAARLLHGGDLLTSSHFDEAFRKIKHSIQSLISDIQQAEQDLDYYFHRENFAFINYTFVVFLNNLPEELGHLSDEIANALINLSVRIQNKEVDFCYTLYMGLKALHCNEETKKIIDQNLKVFIDRKNHSAPQEKEDEKSNFGCLHLGLICFVLFVIIRACVGTSSHKENYQFPSQGDKFESYSSLLPTKLKNYSFQRKLKLITEKQLNPVSADSLSKVWLLKPYTPPMDNYNWLYPNIYQNLNRFQSEPSSKITIINESEYDIVLFLCTDTNMYSEYLKKGEKVKSLLIKGLTLSIYPGKEWDINKWFNRSNDNDYRDEKVYGVFSKVDSTTLAYLNTVFKYEPIESNLADIKIVLSSPFKESLKFSQSSNAFKMYDGAELSKK